MEEFPDVEQKLAAPKKISQFEKDRQAAALKQQRAEEENAAALREFEDSFADGDGGHDDDDGYRGPPSGPRGYGHSGPRGRPGAPPMAPRSGPGSLGPLPPQRSGPGSLDPYPSQRSGPGSLGPSHAPESGRPPTPVMPFGAEKPREDRPRMSMRNAPPPGQFAPPDAYDSQPRPQYGHDEEPNAVVSIRSPPSISQIRKIHTWVEYLFSLESPQQMLKYEAMFMRMSEVRADESLRWLYDSRSPEGLYYRWLLWSQDVEDDDALETRRKARAPEQIFSDVPIDFIPPEPRLPFLELQSLADAVADIDYDTSDDNSDEFDGEGRQFNRGPQGDNNAPESTEREYLSPLTRARLTYLLARLPTTIGTLRKGDVARVTNFAIKNAGAGAEQIVDFLLLNVAKPFCYTSAAKFEQDSDQDEEDVYEPDQDLGNLDSPAPAENSTDNKKEDDGSNAKLIGVYIVSDVLSASSTAGVRNAWKYRQLFEAGFKAQQTFARLGRVEKELGWGRIKAEQWKRKIEVILSTWEGWSVFSGDVLEELRTQFFGEKKEQEVEEKKNGGVPEATNQVEEVKKQDVAATQEDIDGVPMSDSDDD